MAVATTTIVLYRESSKTIIAEVYEGEKYFIPNDVSVFEGSMETFQSENPEFAFAETTLEL